MKTSTYMYIQVHCSKKPMYKQEKKQQKKIKNNPKQNKTKKNRYT